MGAPREPGGHGGREGRGEKSESARWAAQLGRTALSLLVARWWNPWPHWVPERATGPGGRGRARGPPKAPAGEGDVSGVGAVTCPPSL